jgi:DNA-binding MarR family transcriptional regulator
MAETPHAQKIAFLLGRFARLSREVQFSQGLNPAQWEGLRYLARANSYSRNPSAFAAFLGTTKGTASQTLIALEQKGFVRRRRNGCDRRQVALELTARGRNLLARDPLLSIEQAAACLSEDIGAPLANCLGHLMQRMQSARDAKTFGTCPDCKNCRKDDEHSPLTICALTNCSVSAADQRLLCVNFARRKT